MLSADQREEFKRILETRISEWDHALAVAEHEAWEGAVKHADPADQAANEYEREYTQLSTHCRTTMRG